MSVQEPLEIRDANRLPDIFKSAPILTSHNAGWSNISLEAHCLTPGETPEFCLDHYVVNINMGQGLQVEQVVEGKSHKATVFHGAVVICPIYLDEGVWGSYSATSIPRGLGVGTWTPPSEL
ncbi:MAG: hypothetical protein U7123_11370 [Potamolinea sp.]